MNSAPTPPPPTAKGTLAKTPFSHLLVYALERGLTGTLEFTSPADETGEAVCIATLLVVEGHPAKVKTREDVALFGEVIEGLGFITAEQLALALAQPAVGGQLHGQLLIELGYINEEQLSLGVRAQLERKLAYLFAMPEDTLFSFYEGFDALANFGSKDEELLGIDPLAILWTGIKQNPAWQHVNHALERAGNAVVRIAPRATLDRFGFEASEKAAIDRLRATPQRMVDLVQAKVIGATTAQLLIYCLLITKQVDLAGGQVDETALPQHSSAALGEAGGTPAPPNSAPKQAFARVALKRATTHTNLRAAAVEEVTRSVRDPRLASPLPQRIPLPTSALRPPRTGATAPPAKPGGPPPLPARAGTPMAPRPGLVAAPKPLASIAPKPLGPIAPTVPPPSEPGRAPIALGPSPEAPPLASEPPITPIAPQAPAPIAPLAPPIAPAFVAPTAVPPRISSGGMRAATVADDRVEAPPTPPAGNAEALSPELEAERQRILDRSRKIDQENYFEMLGLPSTATKEDVQKAYLGLVKIWHPDRVPAALSSVKDLASKVFSHLSEAQTTLSDDRRRGQYMQLLKDGGATPEDQAKIQQVLEASTDFSKAEFYIKRNDLAQAETHAKRATTADPQQAEYVALLAWIEALKPENQAKDRTLLRIAMLDRAVKMNPNCERAYFYRGMLHKRVDQPSLAIRDFKKASELNPRNLDAVREVRLYNMRAGNSPSAPPPTTGRGSESRGKPPSGKKEEKSGGLFGKLFKK